MAEDNRRDNERKKTIYYFDVFDWKTDKLLGHAVDITTEGLMLVSKDKIDEGGSYQLKMTFPFELEGIKEITFDAVSRWSGKDVNPDYFDTGFKSLPKSRLKIRQGLECF